MKSFFSDAGESRIYKWNKTVLVRVVGRTLSPSLEMSRRLIVNKLGRFSKEKLLVSEIPNIKIKEKDKNVQ